MKVNGSFAFCAAAIVAISATAANAFDLLGVSGRDAVDGSYGSASVAEAFYPGAKLTMGALRQSAPSSYAASSFDARYAECAECAGESEVAGYPVGIPAAVEYAPYIEYGYGYAPYRPVMAPLRAVARPVVNLGATLVEAIDTVRPVRRVLAGAREALACAASYLRPGYVCDPCWSFDVCCDPCFEPCDPCLNIWRPVANPCDPCGIPAAIVPTSVFAPRTCCGYGSYPGEVNALNSTTGLPDVRGKGIDAATGATEPAVDTTSPVAVLSTEPDAAAATTTPSLATQKAEPATVTPAAPTPVAPNTDLLNSVPNYDADTLDPSFDGGFGPAEDALETVPSPQPLPPLGAGVIRMLVPEDAVVYVNGYRTKQKGALRSFAARELEFGETYAFEIRVVAVRDGRVYEDVQTTKLTANSDVSLAFNLKLKANEAYALNSF